MSIYLSLHQNIFDEEADYEVFDEPKPDTFELDKKVFEEEGFWAFSRDDLGDKFHCNGAARTSRSRYDYK
jgi:hypothetical protein